MQSHLHGSRADTHTYSCGQEKRPYKPKQRKLAACKVAGEGVEEAPLFKLQVVHKGRDHTYCFPSFFFFLDLFDSTLFVNKVLQSLMPISQTTGEIIDSNHRRSVRTECNFNWVLLIVHAAARKNMMMLISYKKTNSSHYSAVNK